MRRAILALLLCCAPSAFAAFAPPPRPDRYVTDLAGVMDEGRRKALNERLAQYERETSNQVLVYLDRKLPADTTLEEFANRCFRAWKVGQKDKDNGVVFFAFVDDRKMRIEVGYGLEGALPDARTKQITSGIVVPAFKKGDYAGGVEGAADALMQAARSEYAGRGKTVAEAPPTGPLPFWTWLLPVPALIPGLLVARRARSLPSAVARAAGTGAFFAGLLLLVGGAQAGDTRVVALGLGFVFAALAVAVATSVGDWSVLETRRRFGLALVRTGLGLLLATLALAAASIGVPVLGALAIAAILAGPPVLGVGILLVVENPLRAVTRFTVPVACLVCLAGGAFFLLMLIAGSSGAWVPLAISFACFVLWIGGWLLARAMGWRILPQVRFATGGASSASASSSDSWSSSSSSSDSSWSSSSSSDSSFSGGGGDSGGGGSSDSW